MRDDTVPICCCTALWRNPAYRSNRDRGWPLKHLAVPCLSVQAFHQAVRIYHATRNLPGLLCHLPGHHAEDGCCLIRAGYEGLLAGGLNLVWPCLACPACLVFFDRLGHGFAHADPSSTCVRVGDRSWRKGPNSIPKERETLNRMRCFPIPSAKHAILLDESNSRE
jgi:hypothetical protein